MSTRRRRRKVMGMPFGITRTIPPWLLRRASQLKYPFVYICYLLFVFCFFVFCFLFVVCCLLFVFRFFIIFFFESSYVSAINLSMSNLHLPSLFQSCDNLPTVPLLSASATIHSYPSLSSSAPIPRVKTDTVRNNLSVSDANLPSLFDSHASHPTIPPPPPLPQKHDLKGKGKAKRQLGIDTRSDTKGKGKVTFQGLSSSASMSGSEPEEDMSDKELDMNRSDADGAQLPKVPTIGWRRTLPCMFLPTKPSNSFSLPFLFLFCLSLLTF